MNGNVRWQPPARPAWVDDLNTIGTNLGGAHRLVGLDESSLIDAATAETGLADFGGDSWREPFRVLRDAIEQEADLNTIGRLLTRSEVVRLLENRLRISEVLRNRPAIRRGEIRSPIFITGTARSGTSILHELLAQDPNNRAPAAWEVLYSTPPPKTGTYTTDPRIARADREVTFWHEIVPEYVTMHANGGALPHECIFLMAHEFASDHFSGVLDIPSYARWLATNGVVPALRYHRLMLQLLQSSHPAPRWLLKAPSHLHVLPDLFAVYPDACVILLHRDPLKTVPSTISLMATLRYMRSDRVDVAALARRMASGMAASLEKMTAERADNRVPDSQFIDVRYHDLMRDPVGTIERVYERLGLELTTHTKARIRSYLDAKPSGQHRYSPAYFGLDAEHLRTRYADYVGRFEVPLET
jgi:hypothetical protein